ncbi:AIPR family protein [Acetobacter sicerae]|uniref:AIPR family protein n=1 Tax=Acetobacter sicerae TaxID=85325 RepID=UPI00156BB686|nr:AIPR family protein [Acetobacter sicerae]NHN91183.1 abortive phage infection protein [Acetobacter sicerae]
MANRFDWNALEQKISNVMNENDELNRTKALTAVAASAILEIDLDQAIDSITDGSDDRGVDALFIDDRDSRKDIHLFQAKCVSSFDKAKNNFPSGEIDKIASFIVDLTGHDHEALTSSNPILREKIKDAIDILSEPNATLTVHFVGNMAPLTEAETKRVNTAFSRYRAISFEMHDLDTLSDFFLEKKAPSLNREITVVDTNFFERVDRNIKGIVCSISAPDIINMIRSTEDPENVDMKIFDQNVRIYLKKQNRINKRIIESALSDQNHMFWYQNNGITMTCDKIDVAPSKRAPKLKLHNVQIVNGGQTSNCLFEANKADANKVEDVIILTRIIETTSDEVKSTISETTNSQTPINVRDLRSNDRQQRQLEESILDIGYYYERKTSQHSEQSSDLRVDALSAGQAYLAYAVGFPEVAKKDRGRVFGDLYETVFSEQLTAEKLLNSYLIMKKIDEHKKNVRKNISKEIPLKKGEISIIDGAFHVLFAISQICTRDGKDRWNVEQATQCIPEALNVISNLYEDRRETIPNFSSNRFFKDAKTKDIVIIELNKNKKDKPIYPDIFTY